jgi:hypothetical protein
MRKHRWVASVAGVAIATLGAAAGVSARTPVDPTSLTPPLGPDRVCWQLGSVVQCDTGHDVMYANEPRVDASCGTIYETGEDRSTATRWYEDGLLVRRQVQEHNVGVWSLSPDGSGPVVGFQRQYSWDEQFAVPGDLETGVQVLKGATLLVPALGANLHESGQYHSDTEVERGLHVSDDAAIDLLCPLLGG